MKKLIPFAMSLLLCCTTHAGPHHVTKERNIRATIADYDKNRGILILKDYTDWDRQQTNDAVLRAKGKTKRFLTSAGEKDAAIYIKKGDVNGLRKGLTIEIRKYHYIIDEWTVYPEYESLKIVKPPNKP